MLPEFSNMLSWWQWAALGAIPPAIVLLYFLKLKRRPLEVPSTYLWHKSIEDLHVNSIWQRLRNNLLLYLQLVLVLFVLLALLRPTWHAMHLSGNRLVFLIDNSASMQAEDVKPSRLEEAKRRAGELIDQMPSGSSAMLVSFSDNARVEQNFTESRQLLRDALDRIRPTTRGTNLSEALKLAGGLVNPSQFENASTAETRMFIFSDGRFPEVPDFELGNLSPIFVPIGSREATNVGIVSFGVGRDEEHGDKEHGSKLQAYARLVNCGPADAEVILKLYVNGQSHPINADRLVLPAGDVQQGKGISFDLEDFESGVLRLEAETHDTLAVDDRAWVVVNPPRRAKVLLVTPGNAPLKHALSTEEAAELADVEVESPAFLQQQKYLDAADLGTWDLVIYDRSAPPRMPRTNTFFIGCIPPATDSESKTPDERTKSGQALGVWKARPEVSLPQITDTATTHRLMQWVDTNDIQIIAAATPLEVPPGGTVLIDSDKGPLLAVAPREAFEDVVLGMPLLEERTAADGTRGVFRETDWPWRLSFTAFMYNLLNVRAGQDILAAASYRPGSLVTIDAPDISKGLEVQTPSGASVQLPPSPTGKLVFTATDELGVYRILDGGKLLRQFAVNLLDPAESDIRVAENPKIKIGNVEVAGQTGWVAGHRDIWRELVLAGLAVAVIEWLIYLRRVCV